MTKLIDGQQEIRYLYNEDGRLSEKIFPDGVTSSYKYDSMGLLSGLTHQKDGDILDRYLYEYDQMGNKTAILKKRSGTPSGAQDESGYYQYQYDSMNRLTEVRKDRETLRSYEYDSFGNRIRKTTEEGSTRYYYNAANQLIRLDGRLSEETCQYDPRGNMTAIYRSGKIVNQYAYDETNRLSEAYNANGRAARYEYNGLGSRTGIQEYSLDGQDLGSIPFSEIVCPDSPDKEIDYLLDLTKQYHNLLKKIEIAGKVVSTQDYIWDSNAVFMTERENAHIYLQDELGSTIRVMGIRENHEVVYGYDEFGRDLYGTSGKGQPFGYTGYQRDDIANTYYAQAREYLPRLGRFDKEDLIRRGRNWYVYCDANPLKFIDPLGLDAILINKKVDNFTSVAGIEHMGAFFQDENDDWNYFFWGDIVNYVKIDDPNIFDSMDTMNAYLFEHGLYKLENKPYVDSVYIKGDFTASHTGATELYEEFLGTGEEKNKKYNVAYRNCGQVTMRLFKKGILPGGKTVGNYMFWKGYSNAVIPNWNMINMQDAFHNSTLNLDGFNKAMQGLLDQYEKHPILNKWLKDDYDSIAGCSE